MLICNLIGVNYSMHVVLPSSKFYYLYFLGVLKHVGSVSLLGEWVQIWNTAPPGCLSS